MRDTEPLRAVGDVDDDTATFPRAFGDYLLVERMAVGGMGELFLARSARPRPGARDGMLVVKMLRPRFVGDADYTGRFIDEARTLVHLEHKNICRVHDVGEVGGRLYLTVEFIAGRDLAHIGDRCAELGQPLPPPIALHIVREILEALEYAHRQRDLRTGAPLQLVHRDVSPQNVIVSFAGDIKLIDFGVAKSRLRNVETEDGIVVGKIGFMAPEQLRRAELDGRADQFAAAVLAYEIFTGEPYFRALSSTQITARLLGERNWRPERFHELLSPAVAGVLERALQTDVDARFPSCAAMRDALADVAGGAGGAPTVSREQIARHLETLFPGQARALRERIGSLYTNPRGTPAFDDDETLQQPLQQPPAATTTTTATTTGASAVPAAAAAAAPAALAPLTDEATMPLPSSSLSDVPSLPTANALPSPEQRRAAAAAAATVETERIPRARASLEGAPTHAAPAPAAAAPAAQQAMPMSRNTFVGRLIACVIVAALGAVAGFVLRALL